MYELFAIKYASSPARQRQNNFLAPVADPHASGDRLDCFVWLAVSADRKILIDTGCDERTARARGYDFLRCPTEGLRAIGIEADAIDTIISTHLHWDHAGNVEKFPKARFHAQDCEARFALGPCMCDKSLRRPYDMEQVSSFVRLMYSDRVAFSNGDDAIAPGVNVHLIGGHATGMQAVSVDTRRGPVVIASDGAHLYANLLERNPFPVLVDKQQYLAGLDRLVALAGDVGLVIPGHDPRVMTKYPPLSDALDGVVVRLDAHSLQD